MHIKEYIKTEFGVDYHSSHIYKILSELGYSRITNRSKHPKQQSGVQNAYKGAPSGNAPCPPIYVRHDHIDIWF